MLNDYLECVGVSFPQPSCEHAQLSCTCTSTVGSVAFGMHCGDYGSCGCYGGKGNFSYCQSSTYCGHDMLDCCATGFLTAGI